MRLSFAMRRQDAERERRTLSSPCRRVTAGPLEPPRRQLPQNRIPVHAEYAGSPADVPSAPIQDAKHVLTLELLARLLQRQLTVALGIYRQHGIIRMVSHAGYVEANHVPNSDPLPNRVVASFAMAGAEPTAHKRVHAPDLRLHQFVCSQPRTDPFSLASFTEHGIARVHRDGRPSLPLRPGAHRHPSRRSRRRSRKRERQPKRIAGLTRVADATVNGSRRRKRSS